MITTENTFKMGDTVRVILKCYEQYNWVPEMDYYIGLIAPIIQVRPIIAFNTNSASYLYRVAGVTFNFRADSLELVKSFEVDVNTPTVGVATTGTANITVGRAYTTGYGDRADIGYTYTSPVTWATQPYVAQNIARDAIQPYVYNNNNGLQGQIGGTRTIRQAYGQQDDPLF